MGRNNSSVQLKWLPWRGIFFCWLVCVLPLWADLLGEESVLGPEVEAVTIVDTSPVERILQFFLKELARAAHGERSQPLLVDPKSFEVFFRNFKYKPDTLVERVPLRPTPNVDKIVRATLNSLTPFPAEGVLTDEGDYFLFCDTIRGPHILSITRRPVSHALYEDRFDSWYLAILTPEDFSRNLLRAPTFYRAVLPRRDFLRLLIRHLPVGEGSLPNPLDDRVPGFFETAPVRGYDVSSITNEIQFFSTELDKQRQVHFLALPVVQYTVEGDRPFNFFFDCNEVDLLGALKLLLAGQPSESRGDLLSRQIDVYLAALRDNRFPEGRFQTQIQQFLDRENFSLNYDAIARDKTSAVYRNIRTFLLSQGVRDFGELKRNSALVEAMIEKFFVLGTTYFYRSWTTTREFMDGIQRSLEIARGEGRPLKLKVFACSTGEEVLTFAFQLLENGIQDFHILGTDINVKFIQKAREMVYSRESFERLPGHLRETLLKKYFNPVPEGYAIRDRQFFESRIEYQFQDITQPFPADWEARNQPPFDLISCQNIFLYLNPDVIPQLYRRLYDYLADYGQFILVDKFYMHRLGLRTHLPHDRQLFLNDHLMQALPQDTSSADLENMLLERVKVNPTFSIISQYASMATLTPEKKKNWLAAFLTRPGNHTLITALIGAQLIGMEQYQEAVDLLTEAVYESPYLLNNFQLLAFAERKLQQRKRVDYLNLIIKGTELIYRLDTPEALQQALNLYQGALKLIPEELLGYYALGYQFLRRGLILKDSNALLIDYERFLNQAFKNLHYVRQNNPDLIYAGRGIAEISNLLATSYKLEGKEELEKRLVYNALIRYEKPASASDNFTVLFPLASLQAKMGGIYYRMDQSDKALETLKKALATFGRAEKQILNYKETLVYEFYVDWARAFMMNHQVLQAQKKPPARALDVLREAQKRIDEALAYNTVYGIEAVELRNQILELDARLTEEYKRSFQAGPLAA